MQGRLIRRGRLYAGAAYTQGQLIRGFLRYLKDKTNLQCITKLDKL